MMYNIKFSYTPCIMDGHKAAEVERHVEAHNTCVAELEALGESIDDLIAHILEGIPNEGKLAFAKRACRYMIDNINTK